VEGTFPAKTKLIYSGGNVTVVNLSKEDQGVYECVASNVVTNVITSALLIIECKYCNHIHRINIINIVDGIIYIIYSRLNIIVMINSGWHNRHNIL